MTAPANSPHAERRDQPSRIKRVVLWVGLACLLQFLVFAGIREFEPWENQTLRIPAFQRMAAP